MSNNSASQGKTIFSALIWKFMERMGVSCVQFILQIVLAWFLSPDEYGTLSLMLIFTNLATVFVQRGFNTALIQNKDVTEEDYSSVFWVTLGIAGVIYVAFFFAAPLIGVLYEMPYIEGPFRVLALILFPGALNSIQLAKLSRNMEFKKIFTGNLAGIIVSGTASVIIAVLGGGVWALVAQNLLNYLVACMVMRFTCNVKLRFICNFKRIKVLFSYGWKLLVSSLVDTLYQDIRSLFIGVKYNSATLGYYDRGKQFPHFITNSINQTVQSVMLPAMSSEQDNKTKIKSMMRTSVTLSSYIMFPVMAGLAGVAEPLVELLLGTKWLPCVPYMQIYCFTYAFYPVHSCNLQAINAMGRSDIFLKLEIIKKSYGLIALLIAVFCFNSPIVIAVTGIITNIIGCFVNAAPNKKLVEYSYFEQIKDILPSILASSVMFLGVLTVLRLELGLFATLALQIIVGVMIYIAISAIFSLTPYKLLLKTVKELLGKRKKHLEGVE